MVRELGEPDRPLTGGSTWEWTSRGPGAPWTWCRVYHRDLRTRDGVTPRDFGPLHRFDTHDADPDGEPEVSPDPARSVLYVGADLATSAAEVFGESREAPLCPNYRVALVTPTRSLRLHDLLAPGGAMSIGALPALADGDIGRAHSQRWARAIQDDRPAGPVDGIRYRSAYYGGEALVVWGAGGLVTEVADREGRIQDFALRDERVYPRLVAALDGTRIHVRTVSAAECSQCPRPSRPEPSYVPG